MKSQASALSIARPAPLRSLGVDAGRLNSTRMETGMKTKGRERPMKPGTKNNEPRTAGRSVRAPL